MDKPMYLEFRIADIHGFVEFHLSCHHGFCISTQVLHQLLQKVHDRQCLHVEVSVFGKIRVRDVGKLFEFLLIIRISTKIPVWKGGSKSNQII